MKNIFPRTAAEILALGESLVVHLKNIPDTHGQAEWTTENLASLRTFTSHGFELKHFPPSSASNQKHAFLWDYMAYQQGDGILILAESEHNRKDVTGLKHDFEKLFYAVAPIKLFMFTGHRDIREPTDEIVGSLREYMSECCSRFTPSELYILYCRSWQHATGRSGDRAYIMQVPGEPNPVCELSSNSQFELLDI